MQLIEFDKIIYELSEKSFLELIDRVNEYLSFYYVDDLKLVSRDLFLEKIGGYNKYK